MLSLTAITVIVMHPELVNQKLNIRENRNGISFSSNNHEQDFSALLPTPLSAEIHEEPQAMPISELVNGNPGAIPSNNFDSSSKVMYGSFVFKDWFGEKPPTDHHQITHQDLNVSIGVNFCTLGITLLMIYGAVRGKSLYLMPFFCLQAFDFFVTSLSVIGYLSYVPDIRQILIRSPNLPLREELLAMDPQCLSLLVLGFIILTLLGKIYFISVVWSCYKFLTLQSEAVLECENCENTDGIIDGQNLLEVSSFVGSPSSDLPDYATAMTDPRFAKKPMYPNPPPPYATVVSLPPQNFVQEREALEPSRVTPVNDVNQENLKP